MSHYDQESNIRDGPGGGYSDEHIAALSPRTPNTLVPMLALRRAVDLMPAMLAYWDQHERCVFANARYAEWFGVDAATLPGRSLVDVLGQGYAPSRTYVAKVLAGEAQVFERSTVLPDGSTRHGLARLVPDVVGGHVVGFVANVTDVSFLREREDVLARQMAMLERTGAVAHVGGAELDLRSGQVFWTAEMCRILDVDPKNIPAPERWGDFFDAEDLPKYLRAVEVMREDGTPVDFEARMITALGRRLWVRIQSVADREDDRIVRLRSVHQDITARKESEAALRASDERLRLALAATQDAVWDWNLVTGEMYLSAAWYTMLGYPARDGVQPVTTVREHVHPEDRDAVRAALERAVQTNEPYVVEGRMRTSDGLWRWIQSRGRISERDAAGAPIRFSGTNSDVHERRVAEDARAQLETQLRHAQKLESVGLLAGGIAHDFNNMLLVILGHAEQAMGDVHDADAVRDALTAIQEASLRSAQLTRQLLQFARKSAAAPDVIDVNEAAGNMLSMLRRLIGEHIELVFESEASLWPVSVDPSQFDQVLTNLVVNARDAITGVGRILIATQNVSISEADAAQRRVTPGDYVRLSVTDSGVGMDAATVARIFEPFFTTKAPGSGTGLGLSTVLGIVEQHRGCVDVASTLGAGTTVSVNLPRHTGVVSAVNQRVAAETTRGTETVMVVEDESAILRLVTSALTRAGYTVIAVNDPTDAVRRFDAHGGSVDLVITDVHMPKLNGHDLVVRLRERQPTLHVLFVSGYAPDSVNPSGAETPRARFLSKPFGIGTLLSTIREVLAA